MRNLRGWLSCISITAAVTGCHLHPGHVDGGVLGRVVVYRNGVAFYERNATVEDGTLTVHVPRDQRFAFKSVRLDNPTNDTLEPGPVKVYGNGRFIGEGITEPVPPKQAVVVPFALDRQIIVERTGSEDDRIAKLVTVQRGIVTAEIQHRRQTRFAITSRLHEPSTVYLRHRLESGWTLLEAPSKFRV